MIELEEQYTDDIVKATRHAEACLEEVRRNISAGPNADTDTGGASGSE